MVDIICDEIWLLSPMYNCHFAKINFLIKLTLNKKYVLGLILNIFYIRIPIEIYIFYLVRYLIPL